MSRQPTRCPVCGTWMHDAPAKLIDGVRCDVLVIKPTGFKSTVPRQTASALWRKPRRKS